MKVLNCTRFKEMLVSGANNLANKHEEINTLNVFPVPDGDTGTNMNMTFGSGVAEVSKVMSDHVEALTGVRPTLFRPPYGDYDDEVVLTARNEGYEVIQWSVDSLDWKNKGVQDLVSRSTRKVKSGDIILFHNDSQYIVEALPQILQHYRDQGFQVVKISDILLDGPCRIDHQGCQIPVPVTNHTNIPEVE